MCEMCKGIPNLPSFKKRLLLRSSNVNSDGIRDLDSIRFDKLTSPEQQDLLQKKTEQLLQCRSETFFLKSKHIRLQIRKRTLWEKLKEFSSRGDMKAICFNLVKAQKNGLLEDKKVFLETIESIANNFNVKGAYGKRYKSSTKQFYESLLIMGGPRLANFVAINMEGPNLNTIYRWRKVHTFELAPGIHKDNFLHYAEMVKGIMDIYRITKTPVLAAEDETAIVGSVQYHQDRDELLGFCGPKNNHQCMQNNHIEVGNGLDAYDRLQNAFAENVIGKYARVVILNPLHEKLPRLVALLMPTCNRFSHHTVYHQWQQIQTLYEQSLEDVLGPLIGNSSDGDSRRRKLHLQLMTCSAGQRFKPIQRELGFIFSAKKETNENGYTIRELGDQDVIHNHKKIINHLDHTSRMLYIGPDLIVHMNHIELAVRSFPVLRHGLTRDHVRRDRDRQNWRVAQELTFLRVQECLNDLIQGNDDRAPIPEVKGTNAFLHVVHQYVDIFFSPSATLKERIIFAGFVAHFLGIWRNYIFLRNELTLTANFLSRETYCDILISVHFAVILICFYRDNFPENQCLLYLTGSDCCENFFSKNSQNVGNHQVYPYGQMYRNVSHMIRLSQIEADQNAPRFAKAHIKQENVWKNQYPVGAFCSFTDYPVIGEEITAWKTGIHQARELAKRLGMVPGDTEINRGLDDGDDDGDDDVDDNDDDFKWFYFPFDSCNHDKLFKDLSGDTTNRDIDPDDDCLDSEEAIGHQEDTDDFDNAAVSQDQSDVGDESEQNVFEPTNTESAELDERMNLVMDNLERQNAEEPRRNRTQASVLVPGHGMQYKSTLVKLLNEDPKLSKDRLVRVRQAALSEEGRSTTTESGLILFEDFAFLDKPAKTFRVGRIQRMQRTFQGASKRTLDYKDTVSFSADFLKDLRITFAQYKSLGEKTFDLKSYDIVSTLASDVICHVNLTLENDLLSLSEEEHLVIKDQVDKLFNQNIRPSGGNRRVQSLSSRGPRNNEFEEFDGRYSEIVTPVATEDGRRTSKRMRKQIHFVS